jgi:hypothetical protein
MRHLKRYWYCYLAAVLAILGGMWTLRHKAVDYYAHAQALRECLSHRVQNGSCAHISMAQIHHLEYLGGAFDTYAVIVGLLFGFIWFVVLFINTYMSSLYDTKPQPVPDTVGIMKQLLAATRVQRNAQSGKVSAAGFDTLMEQEMDASYVQATSGAWLTT